MPAGPSTTRSARARTLRHLGRRAAHRQAGHPLVAQGLDGAVGRQIAEVVTGVDNARTAGARDEPWIAPPLSMPGDRTSTIGPADASREPVPLGQRDHRGASASSAPSGSALRRVCAPRPSLLSSIHACGLGPARHARDRRAHRAMPVSGPAAASTPPPIARRRTARAPPAGHRLEPAELDGDAADAPATTPSSPTRRATACNASAAPRPVGWTPGRTRSGRGCRRSRGRRGPRPARHATPPTWLALVGARLRQ